MSDSDPMSELKAMYPKFKFKNTSGTVQTVQLDGDTVQVHERGILQLDSSRFNNLPSTAFFKFIQPTMDDLRAVGLLKTLPTAAQAKAAASTSPSETDPASE